MITRSDSRLLFIVLIFLLKTSLLNAQFPDRQIKWNLDKPGSYVKLSLLNQVWLRYTDLNPGSSLYGDAKTDLWDIGLRRTRIQFFTKYKRALIYLQIGQNNFSFRNPRYTGFFLHDAISEYEIMKNHLSVGAGLTGWSGLLRYSSPSIGNLLTLDAPLYQQATNGINDQFLRKLSVYAKGKIGIIDYRAALTKPLAVQNATNAQTISRWATFSSKPSDFQYQLYIMAQLFDKEKNTTPYNKSTYLGKKKLLNIGIGAIQQKSATWRVNQEKDTLFADIILLGADVFLDYPLASKKKSAITAYLAYQMSDYGPNYIRNVGVMNPTNTTLSNATFSGTGNAFPMIGTGNTFYAQAGYFFELALGDTSVYFLPYLAGQYSQFDLLDDPMLMWEAGINFLPYGNHGTKFTINYQSRPIFRYLGVQLKETQRKGMIQIQYQIAI